GPTSGYDCSDRDGEHGEVGERDADVGASGVEPEVGLVTRVEEDERKRRGENDGSEREASRGCVAVRPRPRARDVRGRQGAHYTGRLPSITSQTPHSSVFAEDSTTPRSRPRPNEGGRR